MNSLNESQQKQLRIAVQDGLPLVSRPYRFLSRQLGVDEDCIVQTIKLWTETGFIKRMGVVVNHRKLGYRENAMVVWNLDDDVVDLVGECFASSGLINLCYRRKRQLPDWPYNLFCMVHKTTREDVFTCVKKLMSIESLGHIAFDKVDYQILFTIHQYKQRGGYYALYSHHQSAQCLTVG